MGEFAQQKERMILECLAESNEPLGSWYLVERLRGHGINISTATVGRVLNSLEHKNCVAKQGVFGRVITQDGRIWLQNAHASDQFKENSKTLEELISCTRLEDYVLVLEARRVIECETTRLAAQNITEKELRNMQALLEEQDKRYRENKSIAAVDISFHRAIAHASRNKVLEALHMLLFSYEQQSVQFERIRARVGAVYMTCHMQILEAIMAHDADRAATCMATHIESLIHDVRKYWELFYTEKKATQDSLSQEGNFYG